MFYQQRDRVTSFARWLITVCATAFNLLVAAGQFQQGHPALASIALCLAITCCLL